MTTEQITRRGLLRRSLAGAAVAIAASAGVPIVRAADEIRAARSGAKRALRIAHITDVHVQPERAAGDGLAACLRHIQSLKDPPQLILNGGDSVMDAYAATADRSGTQGELWRKVLKDECSLPIVHCIGNHDIWGWSKRHAGSTGDEPLYGKKFAMDLFGMKQRYHSFDRAGWRFIALDSTQPVPESASYTAHIDEEQMAWLKSELAQLDPKTPVLIWSHIPILGVSVFFDGSNMKQGNWQIPGANMHTDAKALKDLFSKHPNVKLCLSGHIHLVDRCDYNGVCYICNGAVSGAWWKGNNQECEEGYGLLDLYEDGTFDSQYIAYGWTPRT